MRFMGVERHGTPNSVEHRRERLQRIFYREREKDLLVTKYRDQCNSRGFRKRREAAEAREAAALEVNEEPETAGSLLVQGTGIETSSQCHEPDVSYAENVTQPEDDAISYSAISAYTTSTPGPGGSSGRAGGSGAGGAARLPTPVKLGPLAVPAPSAVGLCRSARTPRSCSSRGGDSGRSIGDAAYASTPLKAGAFDAINEDAGLSEPELEDEAGDERQGNSLEWSVLDSIAAELHKQDNLRARQRDLELKRKLKEDLDRQVADYKLQKERLRVEDEHFLEMEAERTKIWQLQNEQRRAEQQLKIEEMKQHRDRQVVLNKAKSAEEKAQEVEEKKELMKSLHHETLRDKLDTEERQKARRERAHQAFKESSEATRQRKAQADQLALLEQQQVEAYERLRAEREERRREAAEKEQAHRREIEQNAGLRAVAMQRLSNDTESKAAAERVAKDRAAEQQEQANRKKLEDMKSQTQEYLLKQMKEKQLKKAAETEKARQLAKAQAAEVQYMEAQEKERDAFKKKLVYDHQKELKRQIKAQARQKNQQEAMSECELRLNKQLLEKVSLALTDISAKTC